MASGLRGAQAAQAAKLKAGADSYFSQKPQDLTNQRDLRLLLLKGLHLIVGYEQGLNLKSCAEVRLQQCQTAVACRDNSDCTLHAEQLSITLHAIVLRHWL